MILKKVAVNLSIGYQNIEGAHSSTFECKHKNCIELFNDVEILSETWTKYTHCKKMSFMDYILIDNILPQKTLQQRKVGSQEEYVYSVKINSKNSLQLSKKVRIIYGLK